MIRLFYVFLFLIPFQARIYKFLKPMSISWIDPSWSIPPYFDRYADFFISDFLLIPLVLWAVYKKQVSKQSALLCFLVVALISILLSDNSSYPLSYWRWAHLALASMLVFTMSAWRVSLKSVALVVIFSAVLECGIAIPQYLTQHQLGLKFLGEKSLVTQHATTAHFQMPNKTLTSIDHVFSGGEASSSVIRAYGTLPHPNILGGFLVFSIFMSLYLYERSSKKGWIAVALFLQVITLFITYSRAALFALMGGLVIWMILHVIKEKKMPSVWKPAALGAILSLLLFYPQLLHRGGLFSYNQSAVESDQMRLSMQKVALSIIKDHPWFGVGFNNYLLAFQSYAEGLNVQPIFVHNIYLLIAAETGLIGLGWFLMFCGFIIYRGWRQRDSLEGRTLLALFLAILAIGAADYYPMVIQQTRLVFFLTALLLSRVVRDDIRNTEPVVVVV